MGRGLLLATSTASTNVSPWGSIRTTAVCSCLPIRPKWCFPYHRVVMEPAQLQLVVNVIGITGMSSLASFCYLLRKENRKLAAERKAEPARDERVSAVALPQSPQPASPAIATVSTTEEDIRCFAAGRRTGWVKGLTSAMYYDGCC